MATPGEWYASLPVVTRTWGTACVATTAALSFGMVTPYTLLLDFGAIVKKFEIWRLVTPYLVLGGFGFPFLMNLLFIMNYAVPLEVATFEGRKADFGYMLFVGMVAMLPFAWTLSMPFTAVPLVFMLMYVWSRYNPNSQVSLYGVLKLQSFYLPWAMVAITMLLGNDPIPDLVGIAVGHVYYFLVELYPRAGGPALLNTPKWFESMFFSLGFRGDTTTRAQAQAQRAAGFRAFGGGGRRLGGD
eukprot:PRCOL_00000829-RA